MGSLEIATHWAILTVNYEMEGLVPLHVKECAAPSVHTLLCKHVSQAVTRNYEGRQLTLRLLTVPRFKYESRNI